jgi:hypothetical protein
MLDIDILAQKFKEWRGNRRYYRYPTHLWDHIQRLADHHSIPVIAKAFGINAQYLRKKLDKNSKSITFTPVTVISPPVSIEFFDRHSRLITIRFQANSEQLIYMIQSLSGKE